MKFTALALAIGLSLGWLINSVFPNSHWVIYCAIGLALGLVSNKLDRSAKV